MDFIRELASSCRQGLEAFTDRPVNLPVTLLLAGLAGSLLHRVGMCGPSSAGAVHDVAVLSFSLALSLFAVMFCWWKIKTTYDEAEEGDARR